MNGIALAVIAALAGLAMGIAFVARDGAGRLVQRRPPDLPATPGDYGLRYEKVEFTARDGLPLKGYWIPPPGYPTQLSAIVLCPGYRGSLDPDLRYAPALNRAGFGVLIFDF